MERIRSHMEAAIRERWQEPPSGRGSVHPKVLVQKFGRPPKVLRTPEPAQRGSTVDIRHVPVQEATFARHKLVAALGESPEREAFRELGAAVARRLSEREGCIIGVTSPSAANGKTLIAVNLAISLAVGADQRALLLDFDFRAPSVHELFAAESGAGVEDHLFNATALTEVAFSPGIEGLTVLPACGNVMSPDQIMASGKLDGLLEELQRRYPAHILVLDLPCITSGNDAETFGALTDGILLVVEDDVTMERDYRRALQSIGKRNLLGTVLNRVPRNRGEV